MSFPADGDAGLPRSTPDLPVARGQTGLRRMRNAATAMLAVMLGLLLLSALGQAHYPSLAPWLAWVRAFAEAATVGAVADWYAVVALFRHPLGLPIPHTAIIPRNQMRIAESLGSFVERNFLAPALIVDRLRTHNTAKAAAAWLAVPANSRSLADPVVDSLPALLQVLDDDNVARLFERSALPWLRTLDVSALAGNLLQVLTDKQRHQPLLDRGLRAMEQWLTENAGLLQAKFSEASRYTPVQLDAYIVNKFVEGVIALLHEVRSSPDHPLRLQLDEAMQEQIARLRTSERYRRTGQLWMRDCIRHLKREDSYRVLWQRLRVWLSAEAVREDSWMRAMVADMLASLGATIRDDPAQQDRLNAWWLQLVHAGVGRYRHQVPALIAEVVKSWDADEITAKIESEIGRDLQYIRINGTLVGGTVGVLLHAAMLWLAP
ncbi:DUF445 domain-containing protein [Cupriavidus oxalaticus]|uniref:DUF445 domain-containing protein n=1 Tax=Cupriavidus oxalaticus TaxID=96344 RepID=UPI003173A060